MDQTIAFLSIIIVVIVYLVVRGKQNAEAKDFLRNMQSQSETEMKCPSCGSNQLNAGTRGWHWKTGLRGGGQIILTCINCRDKWEPVFKSNKMQ